ncbi:putative O-methyltransferase YrrM [Symbiobacterium terraclitae]|uniref:O-methyltransferase YrrM n=1 Tax=Symbiobacterium terraclitae TaxID=557451 RepID=A0ABS4JWC6_9FIRM|nr:O-methyltransferase [Symbiobacterium terraclitae]MBP2019811.1 putative O-methyltransferase YrrM [Symbiobacterium terraclitae]
MDATWRALDAYFAAHLGFSDPVLEEVLQTNAQHKLPAIGVAPNQGKLLYLLAKMQGARRILEIGTLGGYSTIWLGRALPPDGLLVSLELVPRYAEVARRNIARAGLADRVKVLAGRALDRLPLLEGQGYPPFDLIFIDADKENSLYYAMWALQYSRPGTVILFDNVIRGGQVLYANSTDPRVQGIRRMMEYLSKEPRIEATAIQTVGAEGYDGFLLARVKESDDDSRQAAGVHR